MTEWIRKMLRGHSAEEKAVIELTRTKSALLDALAQQEEAEALVECYEKRIARLSAYVAAFGTNPTTQQQKDPS